jgi:hypothetical protein
MRVFRLSFLVTLVCLISCSILIDTETAQCASDGDCEQRFPSRGLTCIGSQCVPPQSPVVEAGPPPPPPPSCTNAQCMDQEMTARGRSAICVDNKCQRLELVRDGGTLICLDEVLPFDANKSLRDPDVLVIGGFVFMGGGTAPLQDRYALAYRLALEEIRNSGGIDIGVNGAKRPVVMAVCASDPELVEDGLKHLTEDLKVPVIVARFADDKATDLVNRYAIKNGIFTMNPNPAPYALKEQESAGGLVWHLLGGSEDVAQAYAPLVKRLEEHLRSTTNPTGNIKIALVTTKFALDETIAEVIQHGPLTRGDSGLVRDEERAIHFNNGRSTDANAKPASDGGADPGGVCTGDPCPAFKVVTIKSVQELPKPTQADLDASIAQAIKDLKDFAPDIIIAVTGQELRGLVRPLEEAILAGADGGAPKLPRWVLSVGNANVKEVLDHVAVLQTFDGNQSQRFMGIQYAGSTRPDVRTEWLSSMTKLHVGIDQATYSATENSYDAIYWIAYGLFKGTSPGKPANGVGLATGVRSMLIPGAPEIHPGGPQQFKDALRAMREGNVRFVGALGLPDIDPRTGSTIFGTGALYCYQKQGESVRINYDVRRYDPTTKTLEIPKTVPPPLETPTCFANFP